MKTVFRRFTMELNIAKEFTDVPGPRFIIQGEDSGEKFRDEMLYPRFLQAKEKDVKLTIILDGSYGYPTSFLEEAFGGLTRIVQDPDEVLKVLEFVSNDDSTYIKQIIGYIEDGLKVKKK